MIGIGFIRCPKCKCFMIPRLIPTGKTYYRCPSCGYDSANDQYVWTTNTTESVENNAKMKGGEV